MLMKTHRNSLFHDNTEARAYNLTQMKKMLNIEGNNKINQSDQKDSPEWQNQLDKHLH